MNIPYIEASGTPYEIGYAHGSKAKDRVAVCVRSYREMFYDYSGIDWESAKRIAARFVEPVRDYNPDYLEEMRGLADGSGFLFEEILALNARSELVLQGKEAVSDGCTSISVMPERSASGDTILSQNWDWKLSQRASLILLKIRQAGKPDILMVTEAGLIGKIGFNSAGLGACLNALSVNSIPQGVPLHLVLRGILDSETLPEAIAAATRRQMGCCANFLVAQREGESVDIEVEQGDFDVLYADDGVLTHTNHFLSPRLPRAQFRDTCKFLLPDSFLRLGRARKLVRACGDKISAEDLQRIYADHGNGPSSICRHEDPKAPEGNRLSTVFSIIMNLTRGECLLCPANPCDTPYELVKADF